VPAFSLRLARRALSVVGIAETPGSGLAFQPLSPLAPPPAVFVERERLDRGLVGGAFVQRLHNAEKFGAVPQDSEARASSARWLRRFLEFSLDGNSGVPDVPHGFGQPLFRDAEFVSPVLDFVRLKKADAASVLRTFVHEIIGHSVSPV
jgi:hypothetical protein